MATPRLIVGVDLDDVLFDLAPALVNFHNDRYHTSLVFGKMITFDLEQLFDCSVEEKDRRLMEFHDSEYHEKIAPIEGALEAIDLLREMHCLHVITARPSAMQLRTEALIERHFPRCFESVHFANFYFGEKEVRRAKSEICRELGVTVFIDDALHNAVDLAEAGCQVFLPDKPWNQGVLPRNVIRVNGWKEIVEQL